MIYIAATLLYDKRLVERTDPETGEPCQVEFGYIQPGEPIELELDRAEILLAQGDIVLPPEPRTLSADAPPEATQAAVAAD